MDPFHTPTFTQSSKSNSRSDDFVWSFADRQVLQAQEREAQRQQSLKAQSSTLHSPAHRISIWENLHGLRLPTTTSHPILKVVADRTGLTMAQVLSVQQSRIQVPPTQPDIPAVAATPITP